MPQSQRAAALPPDLQWMHSSFDPSSHTADPRHPRLDECLLFEAGAVGKSVHRGSRANRYGHMLEAYVHREAICARFRRVRCPPPPSDAQTQTSYRLLSAGVFDTACRSLVERMEVGEASEAFGELAEVRCAECFIMPFAE